MFVLARFRMSCFLSCLMLLGCSSVKTNPKVVAQDLVHAIPLQSTPAKVIDYLNGHKVEHSQYKRDAVKGNSIEAIVRYDRSEWAVVHTSYGIVFRFDDNNRLIACEVHPEYTGP